MLNVQNPYLEKKNRKHLTMTTVHTTKIKYHMLKNKCVTY